jgi:ABC-type glycerol-3-phosphate transport system substrate-binding protein
MGMTNVYITFWRRSIMMKGKIRMLFIAAAFVVTVIGCEKKVDDSASIENQQGLTHIEGGNGIVSAKPELTGKIRISYSGLNELSGPDPITGRIIYGADELEKWLKKDFPNIEFEIIVYPNSADHYTKCKALMEGRQVDVVIESSTAQIYQEGYSLDLTPYINTDKEYKTDLHSSPMLGTYYREINPEFPGDTSKRIANCLPYDGSSLVMYYDAEIFKQWNVEPLSFVPTLDEIYEKAKKMTGKNPVTGQQNYGIYFPLGGKPSTWNLATVVNALGGDIGDNMPNEWDTKCVVNTPEWIAGLRWVKSIQPFAPPGAETLQGIEKFYTKDNDVAMRFEGSSYEMFRYEALGLMDKYEPVMRPVDKEGRHARLGGLRVQIVKTALDPKTSWEIAKWFSVGNGQRFLASTQVGWPTSLKALGDDFTMSDEMRKTLEAGAPITKKTPIDQLSIHPIMISAIESVTLKNVDPKTALDEAERKKIETYANLKAAAGK